MIKVKVRKFNSGLENFLNKIYRKYVYHQSLLLIKEDNNLNCVMDNDKFNFMFIVHKLNILYCNDDFSILEKGIIVNLYDFKKILETFDDKEVIINIRDNHLSIVNEDLEKTIRFYNLSEVNSDLKFYLKKNDITKYGNKYYNIERKRFYEVLEEIKKLDLFKKMLGTIFDNVKFELINNSIKFIASDRMRLIIIKKDFPEMKTEFIDDFEYDDNFLFHCSMIYFKDIIEEDYFNIFFIEKPFLGYIIEDKNTEIRVNYNISSYKDNEFLASKYIYPSYKFITKMIEDNENIVKFNRRSLLIVLNRFRGILKKNYKVSNKEYVRVLFDFNSKNKATLILFNKENKEVVKEDLEVIYEGTENYKIFLNLTFFIQILKLLKSDTVEIKMNNDNLKPILIEEINNQENITYIQAPMYNI